MIPRTRISVSQAQSKLQPVQRARRKQILRRLYDDPRALSASAALLKSFPEDLLCAAKQHYLNRGIVPTVSALVDFMEPEMHFRNCHSREV